MGRKSDRPLTSLEKARDLRKMLSEAGCVASHGHVEELIDVFRNYLKDVAYEHGMRRELVEQHAISRLVERLETQ